MRSTIRLSLLVLAAAVLIAPIIPGTRAAQQPPQPFEPLVNRIRDSLKLSDQQVSELRNVLTNHAPKLLELRNRAQTNPYAPGLQTEADKEQKAIRDELSAFLDEDQKGKLASVDTRPLVPLGPAFMVINISPRVRIESGATKIASAEHLIPAPAAAKGRVARLTEDQRILHLLNRIGFGPRPGDIDRIKQAGVDRFIEEQLHPETIDDSDLETRLQVLPTQRLASAELYQFYPPPTSSRAARRRKEFPASLRPPASSHRRACSAEACPRGVEQPTVAGSADRFLVQSLQCVCAEGSGPMVGDQL